LAEAVADGTRREFMETLTTVPLLIIDLCEVVINVEPVRGKLRRLAFRQARLHI